MATRVQQLNFGLGKAKQADIATESASYIRFRKLNMDITSPKFEVESDAAEIGKGSEFATQTFPVAQDVTNSIEKYGSAEFVTWAMAYGLGGVAEASSIYTLTPINSATTLELPYFTVVEQIAEGGGEAIDNAYLGCAIEDFTFSFNYGPGRQSTKMHASFVGSGKITTPSAVSLPAVQTEHYMLSQSMALTINGVDYVSAKTILSGSFSWKNNLQTSEGYFPGSGLQNGAAVRGRLEIGNRVPAFEFTTRLLATSSEYTKLVAQTTGTLVLTTTFDSTHTVTITFAKVAFVMTENTEANGILAVKVTVLPIDDGTDPIVSVVAKCGIAGIAQ